MTGAVTSDDAPVPIQRTPTVRIRGSRGSRASGFALLAVLAALLGVYADIGLKNRGLLGGVPILISPWLLIAFAGGRLTIRRRTALLAGPALLVGGLVSYYVWLAAFQHVAIDTLKRHYDAQTWLVLGLIIGVGCAVLAICTRARLALARTVGWSLIAAAPLVDLWTTTQRSAYGGPGLVLALSVTFAAVVQWARRSSEHNLLHLLVLTTLATIGAHEAQDLVLRVLFAMNV